MTLKKSPARLAARVIFGAALILGSGAGMSLPAHAAGDADGDGMPNAWEINHNLNPHKANAKGNPDHDGLRNIAEYRNGVGPHDEDSDNDGSDDGDEVHDGYGSTDVDDADTNNDGEEDGDEDADHDAEDNEDEDDADENCVADDDDRDADDISDEDENDFGTSVRDADSDGDGIDDGEEDSDEDNEADEDEDDSDLDDCDGDEDNDGEDDEDESDEFGTIVSFDELTSTLEVMDFAGGLTSGVVTEDTEIEFENAEESEATTADLQPGVVVAELEFDDETGTLEEVEIYQS